MHAPLGAGKGHPRWGGPLEKGGNMEFEEEEEPVADSS